MKKRKLNWKNIGILLFVVALFSYLIFVIVKFSGKSEERVCKQVIITVKDSMNVKFINTEDVRNILKRNQIELTNKKLKQIQTQKIESIIEQNAFIRKVECYTSPSGDLRIEVWQRDPLFRVVGPVNYYVDRNGESFPTSDEFVCYVPVVTGKVSKDFAISELRDFMLYLRNNAFWDAQIEQIDVRSNKEIYLVPRVGSHIIELGQLERYKIKLAKLKKFYVDGLNKIGWDNYKKISLKYKNQVVCTKR